MFVIRHTSCRTLHVVVSPMRWRRKIHVSYPTLTQTLALVCVSVYIYQAQSFFLSLYPFRLSIVHSQKWYEPPYVAAGCVVQTPRQRWRVSPFIPFIRWCAVCIPVHPQKKRQMPHFCLISFPPQNYVCTHYLSRIIWFTADWMKMFLPVFLYVLFHLCMLVWCVLCTCLSQFYRNVVRTRWISNRVFDNECKGSVTYSYTRP